ncbi:MAG: calcium/sodium antiporter [Bacteroidales bacterium]|nr:calcium/sodium antiporter [Bacteroidales bacterium]
MDLLLFFVGFIFLLAGAHFLIEGSQSIGKQLKIPGIVIGLTIVSLGTSLPELSVSVLASIKGQSELAVSNILGSNTANILLVLGVGAIISPLTFRRATINKEIPFSLLAVIVLGFMAIQAFNKHGNSEINRVEGIILLIFFIIFLIYSFILSKKQSEDHDTQDNVRKVSISIAFIILGIGGLYIGGKWIVKGADLLAEMFGLSTSTIGIKIVAVATSLPEIVASSYAAFKKHSDIAIGNVIGSNIFNIFLVLGLSATIYPIPGYDGMSVDVCMVIFATLLLFVFIFRGKGWQLTLFEGVFFLITYMLFVVFREKILFWL